MLSKSKVRASAGVLLFLAGAGCSSARRPWNREPAGDEINIGFTLHDNVPFLSSTAIDGRTGRFILATANRLTSVDPAFATAFPAGAAVRLTFGQKTGATITPVVLPLTSLADAVIGADAFGRQIVAIDYRRHVVSLQHSPVEREDMAVFTFQGAPQIDATIDGAPARIVVDTSLPDTLVLPARFAHNAPRGNVSLTIGRWRLGSIDVRYADVSEPHAGTRLLARFLVSIDYGRGVIGLWPYSPDLSL